MFTYCVQPATKKKEVPGQAIGEEQVGIRLKRQSVPLYSAMGTQEFRVARRSLIRQVVMSDGTATLLIL